MHNDIDGKVDDLMEFAGSADLSSEDLNYVVGSQRQQIGNSFWFICSILRCKDPSEPPDV